MKVRWLFPNLKPYDYIIPTLNPKPSHRTRVLLLLCKAARCCCSLLQQLLLLLQLLLAVLNRRRYAGILLLLLPAGLLPCNPIGHIF
jgi:hypothetical protein